MGGISVQRLPKRDVSWRRRSARPRSRCNRAPTATRCRPRWSWIALSGLPRNALWRLGLSALIEDTERPQVILGVGASTWEAGLPSRRLFCASSFRRTRSHEVWHRSTHRRTRVARAARGQARGIARASRFRHRRSDAFAGCAGRMRRHQDQRGLRPAAWSARRQAGQHDRVAGLQRSGAWHPGLQSLWRGAQADRCDDGCIRCDPRRSAGSGLPDLYVHHDAALRPRSGIATSQGGLGAGPAQSRGPAGRRSDAARRLGKLCRRGTVADASWAHAWRTGSVVRQDAQARCRVSDHRDAGLAARCRAGFGWPLGERTGSIPVPMRRIFGWRAPMRGR